MDRVRTCAEECPYLEGFMITRSVEGGTGSGLATRLLESLSNEYKKKTKCELCVCPKFGSNPNSDQTVYNSVLSLYKTLELVDHSICIDNKSLTSISERRLRMKLNTNENNKLVSYFMSSFTSPMRHGGVLNASLNEIVYNLQPLPRLRYSIPSIAPLISRNKDNFEKNNAIDLTNNLFLNENQFLSCDLNNEKYLSCYMGYQGSSFEINDIYDGISKAINNHSDSFTDWSRDAFKLSLNARAPYSSIFNSNRLNTACRLANTTAFRGHLTSMAREFDLIYEKRDFVQSFVAAGMEEGDFVEARERLATLKTNYQEVLNTNDESVEAQSDDERLLERDFN